MEIYGSIVYWSYGVLLVICRNEIMSFDLNQYCSIVIYVELDEIARLPSLICLFLFD
jgi:hypothetical protein